MNRFFAFATVLTLLLVGRVSAQFQCANDASPDSESVIPPLNLSTAPFVIVLVDFPDGRKPDGTIAMVDADTAAILNIDATGSMGWVRSDPGAPFRKKIRKYTYEDYWNMIFGTNEYSGSGVHPDYSSHQGYDPPDVYNDPGYDSPFDLTVYGSMRDYYAENSYGVGSIGASQTRPGSGKLNTGIVNHIDTANGKNYVRWIKMPQPKTFYDTVFLPQSYFFTEVENVLRQLHSNQSSPNYIAFDVDSYLAMPDAKMGIIVAGGGRLSRSGSLLTGRARDLSSNEYVINEKSRYTNTDVGSVLDGILGNVHEYGHLLGLQHIVLGNYDPMHYGLLGNRILEFCPPHFNPLTKLMLGWISSSNVTRVRKDSSFSLRPIELPLVPDVPILATITVYGDLGKYGDYAHSEGFIVEYRRRSGFNRFTGGLVTPTGYNGGALVWRASRGQVNLLKVSQDTLLRNPGKPDYSYPYHGTTINSQSNPSTVSTLGIATDLSISNFSIVGPDSLITGSISYQSSVPPAYDAVLGSPQTPGNVSGLIYLDKLIETSVTVAPGSTLEMFPASGFQFLGHTKFVARGTSDSITFRGIMAGGTRLTWGTKRYVAFGQGTTGIYFDPSVAPDSLILRNCIFKDVTIAVNLNSENYPGPSSWIRPVIQGNRFPGGTRDFIIVGTVDEPAVFDISGYDQNSFGGMFLLGQFTLKIASQFATPQTALLRVEQRVPDLPGKLELASGSTLIANGPFELAGHVSVVGGTVSLNGTSTILANSTFSGSATTCEVGTGTTITLGSNVNLVSENSATLSLNPNVTMKFGNDARISSFGILNAVGSSSQPITLTSNKSSPPSAPGDWYGVQLFGGPNTIKYCNVRYAKFGVSVLNNSGTTIEKGEISDSDTAGVYEVGSVSYGALRVKGTRVTRGRQDGIVINQSWASIEASAVVDSNARFGLYSLNSGVRLDHAYIRDNSSSGIEVSGSASSVYLARDLINPGHNLVSNNGGWQVRNNSPATTFIGHKYTGCDCPTFGTKQPPAISSVCNSPCSWQTHEVGGYNTIVGGTYWVKSTSTATLYADLTDWGTCPDWPSGVFEGTISSAFPLNCDGPTLDVSTPIDPTPIAKGSDDNVRESSSSNVLAATKVVSDYMQYLRAFAVANPDSADHVIPILSGLAGETGEFKAFLGQEWESYLASTEGSSPSPRLRRQALMYRIQNRMNKRDYSTVLSITEELLQRSLSDEMWYFCQWQRICALAMSGNLDVARQAYRAISSRARAFDPLSSRELDRVIVMLSNATATRASSASIVDPVEPILETEPVPQAFSLYQNYPNPFNPLTRIRYSLPIDAMVTVRVFDVLGQEVALLVDDSQTAGVHEVVLDAAGLSSGIYFCRMQSVDFSAVKKLTILR
jgi:M6 family metalloprotease-like protein